jgi:hypothetical protein
MRLRATLVALVALVALAAPAASQARGLPPCPEAPCASDTGPILLLSYYRGGRNLQKVIYAVRKADLPAGVPVYYGDYWGSGAPHQHVPHAPHGHGRHLRRMESGRYAPIFTIRPSTFYARRQLPADERRALNRPALGGRLPPLAAILRRGWRYRYDAGLELGRRFRDQIRIKRAAGRRVTTWQLDELPSELAGRSGARMRGFLVGVLRGIAYGRPRLADKWLPGIVFATPEALSVGARRASPAWQGFWQVADAVSLYLVGEEYPPFVGRPSRAALRMDLMRRRLYRAGNAAPIARREVRGRHDARLPAAARPRRQRPRPVALESGALACRVRARAGAGAAAGAGRVPARLRQRARGGARRRGRSDDRRPADHAGALG